MKEASRGILGRLGHVKLCNMHLQMYICFAVDEVRSGSDSFPFKLNQVRVRICFIIDEMSEPM